MSVMTATLTIMDGDEEIVCQGCGKSGLDDYESFYSQADNYCGHINADSGNYCDDCYPRCFCDE